MEVASLTAHHCLCCLFKIRLWFLDSGQHSLSYNFTLGSWLCEFVLACHLCRWSQRAYVLGAAWCSCFCLVYISVHFIITLVSFCAFKIKVMSLHYEPLQHFPPKGHKLRKADCSTAWRKKNTCIWWGFFYSHCVQTTQQTLAQK